MKLLNSPADRHNNMSERRPIVIAMDGSEYSEYAFQWYMDNIHREDDHVVIVFAPEYHNVAYSFPAVTDVSLLGDVLKQEKEKVTKMSDEFAQKLKDHQLHGKVRCISGEAGEVICRAAEEEGALMIVTGTRGMGTIRRTFTGCVSDYVIHHSNVPVIVCRHKDHHKHYQTHSVNYS